MLIEPQTMHPGEQIVTVISRIYQRGLTTTSGGNISVMDARGDIWITPSAVDKGSLKTSDIVCIKRDGTVVGNHIPSSELPFHRAIYQIRPDIRAIIHAHPSSLVAFSLVHQIPDPDILAPVKEICGEIGYVCYEIPGSQALGDTISAEFQKGLYTIVMENHGVVVGGFDMTDAYIRFETIEFAARTTLHCKTIGEPQTLSPKQIDHYKAHSSDYLPEMEEASSEEMEKRAEICRFVQRGCDQGLMFGSFGTVSLRLDKDDFLITPSALARWNLKEEDIVLIKNGKREPGKIPGDAVWLHEEIYRNNPGIHAVIMARTPYLMAFAITHQSMNVRTIPESWIFLQDLPSVRYESYFSGAPEIGAFLARKIPAVLIQNDSVVVTGESLLQTFDRLEVAEFSAQSLVMAKPIGKLVPINDQQIEELRKVYIND
ncbi:MAG TPA: class II aldolase/adducin family protein [Prolixibacteraceae bacterium]|nr:class II aldolase/adducin family protein [Prolixibacteraceae bacterium]